MKPEEIYQKYGEALVFMGAGGQAEDWILGIAELLFVDGITQEKDHQKIWKTAISLKISPDRTDLILPFTDVLDTGKLAVWRIKACESLDVMWLSDYINNPQIRGVSA